MGIGMDKMSWHILPEGVIWWNKNICVIIWPCG